MKKLTILFIVSSFALMNPLFSKAQTGKEKALESMGTLSGLAVYNTYLAIGAIGDGFEEDVYTAETVAALMSEQNAVLTTLIDSYDELLASGFITDANDKTFIEDTKEICRILKSMTDHLSAYSKDKSEDHSSAFQSARESAWSKIAALLQIEE